MNFVSLAGALCEYQRTYMLYVGFLTHFTSYGLDTPVICTKTMQNATFEGQEVLNNFEDSLKKDDFHAAEF